MRWELVTVLHHIFPFFSNLQVMAPARTLTLHILSNLAINAYLQMIASESYDLKLRLPRDLANYTLLSYMLQNETTKMTETHQWRTNAQKEEQPLEQLTFPTCTHCFLSTLEIHTISHNQHKVCHCPHVHQICLARILRLTSIPNMLRYHHMMDWSKTLVRSPVSQDCQHNDISRQDVLTSKRSLDTRGAWAVFYIPNSHITKSQGGR